MVTKKTKPVEEKEPTDPEAVATTAAEVNAQALADFGWAVSSLKLNRAKAFVQSGDDTKNLKGKALEDAVKARYIALGGLLKEDAPVGRAGKKGGKVQNMADDDGSDD